MIGGWLNRFYDVIQSRLCGFRVNSHWIKTAKETLDIEITSILNLFKPPAKGTKTRYCHLYNKNKTLQVKAKDAHTAAQKLIASEVQSSEENTASMQ